MKAAPICTRCKKNLSDWTGNVMVDGRVYPQKISGLHVLCKACTRELDDRELATRYHNIWELQWVKESPMSRLAILLKDQIPHEYEAVQWEKEAVLEAGFLIALTLSYDEARTFLRYLNPSEWDYDGTYLKRLKVAHGLDVDS